MPERLGPCQDDESRRPKGNHFHLGEMATFPVHEILGFPEARSENFANLLDASDFVQAGVIVIVLPLSQSSILVEEVHPTRAESVEGIDHEALENVVDFHLGMKMILLDRLHDLDEIGEIPLDAEGTFQHGILGNRNGAFHFLGDLGGQSHRDVHTEPFV